MVSALLAGRRDIASIARMANLLDQDQRFALALPRQTGKKIRLAPCYSVFYEVLTRLDPEHFAHSLTSRCCARSFCGSAQIIGLTSRCRASSKLANTRSLNPSAPSPPIAKTKDHGRLEVCATFSGHSFI